jgi:hypothetical protein
MAPSAHTHTGFRLLVRPLVRFCLRHSIKIQEAYSVLKSEFVAEAHKLLENNGEKVTTSKLSVITGIPRKLISTAQEPLDAAATGSNLILNVIERWRTDPEYRTPSGIRPRPLSCEGADSEFAELVRQVSVDLNPYTVLFELERVHVVSRKDGSVRLLGSLFLERDLARALAMGADDAEALIRVIEHNVQSKGNEHLHLTTTFDNIPDKYVEEIREWVLEEGSRFQRRVREHLSQFDRDSSATAARAKGRNTVQVVMFEFTKPTNE